MKKDILMAIANLVEIIIHYGDDMRFIYIYIYIYIFFFLY